MDQRTNVHVPCWLLLGLLLSGATRLTNKLSPPGVESMLYCTATQHTFGKRERMKATHPSAVFVCASSANYMTVLYQFLNEAVFGNNRFPDGPQFDIWNCFPEIARFWSILQISQCAFAGLIQSSSQSFQGCQPKTECRQIIPMAFNHCNIRFFSTNFIYQIMGIMKHQLDHLTECLAFFFPNKPLSIQVWCLGNATCVVDNGTCTGTAGGAGVTTCKWWTKQNFTWNRDLFDKISWRFFWLPTKNGEFLLTEQTNVPWFGKNVRDLGKHLQDLGMFSRKCDMEGLRESTLDVQISPACKTWGCAACGNWYPWHMTSHWQWYSGTPTSSARLTLKQT